MRNELRDVLIAAIPEVGENIHEPTAVGPKLALPYLILREAIQDPGESYSNFTTMYEVWPSVKRTTFAKVDDLANKVIEALNQKRFDVEGIPHYIEYKGTTGEDTVLEEWDLITRGLKFQIFNLAWLVSIPFDPDPVSTMDKWTNQHFSDLETDPITWQPQNGKPALYWRIASITDTELMPWGAWLTVKIQGHLIALTDQERTHWVQKVCYQLGVDKRVIMDDRSPLMFLSFNGEPSDDPFRTGQIQLHAQFGVLGSVPDAPLLIHPKFDTIKGGEGNG
ncbi:hypothetical protein ACERJO_11755 [Halalkalibacter sp. AB-rgal2]|uniref:hypothetical protein n=1 Tax=Halalkalibacter sp. AB-rgal2 TaxID=3242695 RepID=UPI00359EDF5F